MKRRALWVCIALALSMALPLSALAEGESALEAVEEIGGEALEACEETGGADAPAEGEPEAPAAPEGADAAEAPAGAEASGEGEAPEEPELPGKAEDSAAMEDPSADAAARDVEPLARVRSVEAAQKGVCIRWDAVPGVERYRVMYRTGSAGKWKKLADAAGDSYVWKKAADNRDYFFTLRCLDASGAELPGAYDEEGVRFRRLKAPSIAKAEATLEGIRLSWKKVSGAQRYLALIERDGMWQPLGAVEDTSYLFADVESGGEYRFSLCCAAEDGITPVSGWSDKGKSAPWFAAPRVERVEAAAAGIQIEWSEVPGAAKYRLYARSGGGSWKKVADATGTRCVWKKAKANTAYEFAVCCMDKKGKARTSGMIEDTGNAFTLLPTPKLAGAKLEPGGVRVSWKAVTGAERYAVLCRSGSGAWEAVGYADAGETDYLWPGAESGASYRFTVRCVSADGALGLSGYNASGASAKFLRAPAVRAACTVGGVRIEWDPVPGAVKYRLMYKQADAAKWSKLKDTAESSFLWTGAKSGVRYAFTAVCIDKKGKSRTSACDETGVSLTYVAAPVLTRAVRQSGGVRVEWEAVPGAAGYQLLRRSEGGEWTPVAATVETGCTWTGGETGAFTVRCLSEDGQTPASAFDAEGAIPASGAPKVVQAAWSGDNIAVSWSPVEGAVNYRVAYRDGDVWKAAGNSTGSSFTWKKPKGGRVYCLSVACVSASGTALTSDFDEPGITLLVPMKKLANYKYFCKYMSDAQFKKAYAVAKEVVEPLADMSREDQLFGIMIALREMVDDGMNYSTRKAHYNDPYGYFVLKYASCAGCTRATGLCLNILGIKYEHVHENKWCHQWARVKVGSEYWICDAFGLCCGPEPATRRHPFLN